jgi:hypothetical protein
MIRRRSSIVLELRELDHRRSMLLEELELVKVRDDMAARIMAGYAANPNPDQGLTVVEVLRALELADKAIEKSGALPEKLPFSSLLHDS